MAKFKSDADCRAFFLDVCDELDAISRLTRKTKDEIYDTFVKTDEPYKDDNDFAVNIDYMNQHFIGHILEALDDLSNAIYDEMNKY